MKSISVTIALLFIGGLGYWWFSTSNQVDFNAEVRPILNSKCLACHGGVREQADLSFLYREAALEPAESGKKAIVPGKPSQSELIKRITHQDPEMRMPPEGDPLSEQEVKILKKWINQGAKWDDHWAYIPVESADLQSPKSNASWGQNEIDFFILNKMKAQGLSPSEPADKATLARRVSLDLIGLPPDQDQLQNFLNDDSDDAFAKYVDVLLSSPHFGERWASVWLDLARYADSQGYQKDHLRRSIWRYRDWVIDAFNNDMPFDQFTIEQLAGDLLENPTDEQLLATAFHRNTMTNDEGGTDDEEFRVAAVIDRMNTTFEIWQGTTIACVQCHSHPYDPFDHEEFYNIYAFFNTTADTDKTSDEPTQVLMSPVQKRKAAELKKQLSPYESTGDTLSEAYQKLFAHFREIKPAKIPVMRELPDSSQRKSFVFERGNWLVHGKEVQPDVPKVVKVANHEIAPNRLGLAQWLMHPDNPLTARVLVNRFWEQVYGKGIVGTLEDFGTQGFKPTHQEMLDWLAYQFVHEDQWNVKALLRRIVLSATYQQSSKVDPIKLEKDPYNNYYARSSRVRLSAEQIRDQALHVSGLLSEKLYGPSVMPKQPDGVWNMIRHIGSWETSQDGDQHRRGLYTFWRRVSPYPSMIAFDAPSRELCVSRRIRTNTPLQALITLNDPVFMEASEALAHRALELSNNDFTKAIGKAYQLATQQLPDEKRMQALVQFYEKTIKEKTKPDSGDAALNNLAKAKIFALVNTANVILNLDEVIMKS